MPETLSGVLPVVPTIFSKSEDLDMAGYRRVLDYLIDAGSDGLCILANYSEQFSLTDSERAEVLETTMAHVGGRVPVIVTTSHYSARVAAERSLHAQELGASMVMLMPPFFGATMKVGDAEILEFFRRVADGLTIDIMIQDAPMSTSPLSVELLTRVAQEIPQVRYAKIEVPRAADKLRSLAAVAGDSLPGLFDGEEGVTLIPDLEAGAVGAMTSALIPDRVGTIVRDFHAGDRVAAREAWEAILPLIHFENRQCGLAAAKIVLQAGGVIESDLTRWPLAPVSAASRQGLIDLARRNDALALRWA
ncbi:MAG: dihydrodipicolinate synthase family protein [Microcella sp.]|uniref:dihydrodipicolinate synthase family protein n=1 Tax=Microcella sp. TaxID=1913979 RepID=UPI003314A5F3